MMCIVLVTVLDTDLDTALVTHLHSMSFSLGYYEGVAIHNLNVPPVAAVSTVKWHTVSMTSTQQNMSNQRIRLQI